jgi:hypothetical protein
MDFQQERFLPHLQSTSLVLPLDISINQLYMHTVKSGYKTTLSTAGVFVFPRKGTSRNTKSFRVMEKHAKFYFESSRKTTSKQNLIHEISANYSNFLGISQRFWVNCFVFAWIFILRSSVKNL